MGKAVVHCSDIGKPATGIYDGKFFSWIALEKKQSRIRFIRISSLFFFGIDIVEDAVTGFCMVSQMFPP